MGTITRENVFKLLKKYNKDPLHLQHAIIGEAIMKGFAKEEGYETEAEYGGIIGLFHDIDFELYPDEHCLKAPGLLRDAGISEDIIYAVCSHGYGITVKNGTTIEIEPVHHMEILFKTKNIEDEERIFYIHGIHKNVQKHRKWECNDGD